jgi:hypothetical protein
MVRRPAVGSAGVGVRGDASERAAVAEARADSEIDRAVSRHQRKAERLTHDFAGMGATDLSAGIDPHGF